jgi:ornithine cyclodeaminase/alanine dehydrogenase-like protein (mu-crystallin family)
VTQQPRIVDLEAISKALVGLDLVPAMEAAFERYSAGKALVPPVGELLLRDPPGEIHIKHGYVRGDDYYIVKIASGFPMNSALGLPSGNGLMLLFNRLTGELAAILLDQGLLTDVRTAAAGAVAAKYCAPSTVGRIGIMGTGVQSRLQLRHLADVVACRNVLAWGRNSERLERYRKEMEREGFAVSITRDAREVAGTCSLIVTTTASTEPILHGADVLPGTHITAVGSDTPDKRELDSGVLAKADVVIADSRAQCVERGEIAHAVRDGVIAMDGVIELGEVVAGKASGRQSDDQITVADLTGVAVQDAAIATAVFAKIVI